LLKAALGGYEGEAGFGALEPFAFKGSISYFELIGEETELMPRF